MQIIVGIDPGSRNTGYGIIRKDKGGLRYVASGVVQVADLAFPERLHRIFTSLQAIFQEYQPNQLAIEQVFMAKNADSALKLGHARGAAICAGTHFGLPVSEYSARQVKQAVVGTGAAQKAQVQHMVKALLNTTGALQEDAADALAVAICHYNVSASPIAAAQRNAYVKKGVSA